MHEDIEKLKAEVQGGTTKIKASFFVRLCDAILDLDRRLKAVEGGVGQK